jgi:transposase
MFHVRTTKTTSGATAVQVVRYRYRKMLVLKHIGSAHSKEDIASLKQIANQWIEQETRQQRLLPEETKKPSLPLVSIDKLRNLGFRSMFAYETLTRLLQIFNLSVEYQLLLDLVLIRIIQPASKLESFALLAELFDIHHERTEYYRLLPAIVRAKESIEKDVVALASKHFSFDFSMVFYDVTTLYYESFTEDEDTFDEEGNMIEKGLRKGGLGKEIKIGQPIIVIGLMVTKEGFPISYEVYEGNTFEGDTFLTSILSFKNKHAIKTLTIVADAAMISFDNIEKLKEHLLSYIVGGRMANLKQAEMKQVHKELIGQNKTVEELQIIDGKSTRIQTERGLLLCDFSMKRYLKDKREMEKQIIRAENLIAKNTDGKRTKFLMLKQSGEKTGKKKKKGEAKEKAYALNTNLIEKTKLLLGIKGYYTNLFEKDEKLTDQDIISHYHSLWHVEKAFRIAKSDLQMRPVYAFKRHTIEAHILICFMALAVCKFMELKTKKSTKVIIKLLKQVTDARILNTLTNEEIILRSELSTETKEFVKKLSL